MDNRVVNYVVKVFIQKTAGLICFVLGAGTLTNTRGQVFFVASFLSAIPGLWILWRLNPEVLAVRAQKQKGSKSWDDILVAIYAVLAFLGVYFAAGLDVRFSQLTPKPVFWVGFVVSMVFGLLGVLPMAVNRHFEGHVRIQTERSHTVCDVGPYRIVRHPGYALIILSMAGIPMMFGWYSGIVVALITVLLVVRTHLEDETLHRELPGYLEYAQRVRYRLLPFVW